MSHNPFHKLGLFKKKDAPTRSPSTSVGTKHNSSSSVTPQQNTLAAESPKLATKHAVALYDYQAFSPEELSFHVNDNLLILKQNEDWWTAVAEDGTQGEIPGVYVKIIEEEMNTNNDSVALLAVALFSFHSDNQNELGFNTGDKLIIFEHSGEWWLAKRQDSSRKGWVPANYLKLEEKPRQLPSTAPERVVIGAELQQAKAELSFQTGDFEEKQYTTKKKLPEALSEEGKLQLCAICLAKVCGMVCLPCGHVCMCSDCGATFKLPQCPMCSTPLQGIIKIFV